MEVIDAAIGELIAHYHVLGIMLLLLCASAFFSGSETALFSLTPATLSKFKSEKGGAKKRAVSLLASPTTLLSLILFGNMAVNLMFSALATLLSFRIWNLTGNGVAFAIEILFLLVLIVFGEVTPKTVAVTRPELFAVLVATPMSILKASLGGFVNLLDRLVVSLTRFAEVNRRERALDLQILLEMSARDGFIDRREHAMLSEVTRFSSRHVWEVMKPRIELEFVEANSARNTLEAILKRGRLKVIAVYEADPENVIGILHARDFFLNPDKNVKDLIKPVMFVPEYKTIADLISEFISNRRKIAAVVDEYGGLEGFVTLEDILEEIVGEFESEFGRLEQPIKQVADDEWRLQGSVTIRQWNESFETKLPSDEARTVAGLLTARLGRFPTEGEVVEYGPFNFWVARMRGHRVVEIGVRRVR